MSAEAPAPLRQRKSSSLSLPAFFFLFTMANLKLPNSFVIPDFLTMLNFPFGKNPHLKEAGAESAAWFNAYNIFKDRTKAEFIQSCTELLTSYFYPTANYDQFRLCCDFMNIAFLVDEVFDNADGEEAAHLADVYINALKDDKDTDNKTPFYLVIRE